MGYIRLIYICYIKTKQSNIINLISNIMKTLSKIFDKVSFFLYGGKSIGIYA